MNSGLYILASQEKVECDLPAVAAFRAVGQGALFTQAQDENCRVLFEGILTSGRQAGQSDAEVALQVYADRGLGGCKELEGFFNLAIVDKQLQRIYLVSDPLATRPLYIYRASRIAMVAPCPAFFKDCGLVMNLDRQGLYQTFRFYHPIGRRSFIREIIRSRPLTVYEFHPDGRVEEHLQKPIAKDENSACDLDGAAREIKEIMRRVLEGILSHPLLQGRSIHLPLTAGMDSRHMLGELIEQQRPPDLLRHVRIRKPDYVPVQTIANDLCIPLESPSIDSLDLETLTRDWIRKTVGFLNFHQIYLMAVAQNLPENGVIGFDGYLADHFLGCNRRPGMPPQRHLTPFGSRALFKDHRILSRQCQAEVQELFDIFSGPENFRVRMFDAFNRGVYYTGGVFPILGDHALYFAPGAHRQSVEFCRTAPESLVAFKRARLRMFRQYFPKLAAYAGEGGRPLLELEVLPHKKSKLPDALIFAKGMLTFHRHDPAKGTCHEWLRKIPFMKRLQKRVVKDSALVRDGHLLPMAGPLLFRLHQAGAYLCHTLMSLTSAEVAYRSLVKGESLESISDWLTRG